MFSVKKNSVYFVLVCIISFAGLDCDKPTDTPDGQVQDSGGSRDTQLREPSRKPDVRISLPESKEPGPERLTEKFFKPEIAQDTNKGKDSPPACGTSVSFRDEIYPILASCSCHAGRGAHDPPWFLNLKGAYEELVNKRSGSKFCSDKTLVVPGDTKSSYLLHKLEAAPNICGDKMPPRGQLSASEMDKLKRWICHGAPFN